MAKRKPPIYTFRGVRVKHENFSGRYVMCIIYARPDLFPNTKVEAGYRQYVRRSRMKMAAKLGRPLLRSEHVHHKNEDTHDDRLTNLSLKSAFNHNSEHHRGMKHSVEAKARIAASLSKAYASGRRKRPNLNGSNNPFFGRKHTAAARARMSQARRKM